jgi:hypothetical protein
MVPGWKKELSIKVSRLIDELINKFADVNNFKSDIALRTNCLPVYSDMSGTILLSIDGVLYFFDDDCCKLNTIRDKIWENVALTTLARDYADLAELHPSRPEKAIDCPGCFGAGRVTNQNITCGVCGGTGWVL